MKLKGSERAVIEDNSVKSTIESLESEICIPNESYSQIWCKAKCMGNHLIQFNLFCHAQEKCCKSIYNAAGYEVFRQEELEQAHFTRKNQLL